MYVCMYAWMYVCMYVYQPCYVLLFTIQVQRQRVYYRHDTPATIAAHAASGLLITIENGWRWCGN